MASPASDKSDISKSESSGGIKSMLPLILNIVLMPVIAFLMTQFVLIPKLTQTAANAAPKAGDAAAATPAGEGGDHGGGGAHGAESSGASGSHDSGGHGGGGAKDSHGGSSTSSSGAIHSAAVTAMFKQPVTVNVAGTMGSRLMMAKIGLRGMNPKLGDLVTAREEDLRDAAANLLQTKTLMDIERQGSRNTIKSELKAAFHKLLGPSAFSEVVLPDLAVQ
ncbi:MAG: flagellar basal body-associated FliL family protein [Verrucomicrobium sp.]|jgi:flagellar basal body-associated protein FliL|nr:flagellar basal body-associated FliL family protein [Verrucomicrobium sp.]